MIYFLQKLSYNVELVYNYINRLSNYIRNYVTNIASSLKLCIVLQEDICRTHMTKIVTIIKSYIKMMNVCV